MVIAHAGRRIDAPDAAVARFPASSEKHVREELARLYGETRASAVVSSAACGADLLALDEALRARLRCRVVLPFPASEFRETSVTDRPGQWGELYDSVLARSEVRILNYPRDDDSSYEKTNRSILDEGADLAAALDEPLTAAVVWDGKSRGEGDLTEAFLLEARRRGLNPVEILTITRPPDSV